MNNAAARRILFFADASHVHTRRWVQAMAERGFQCVVATRLPGEVPGAVEVVPIAPGGGSQRKIVEIRKAALLSSSRPAELTAQASATRGEATIAALDAASAGR